MPCACIKKLSAFVASLENLPLNAMMDLLPEELPQLTEMSGLASGAATAHSMTSAMASPQLAAKLKVKLPPFPIPLPELAKLEALAIVGDQAGCPPTNSSFAARLSAMSNSINLHLPSTLQMLMELLEPHLEVLLDLLELLQSVEAINTAWKVNLFVPGAMPKIELAIRAMLNLSPKLSVKAELAPDLGSYCRLLNAGNALGFNLALTKAWPQFQAALDMAVGLPIPPLEIDIPEMNALTNALQALSAIASSSLAISLSMPGALNLFAAALNALMDNLNTSLELAPELLASANEIATVGSSMNAVAPCLHLNVRAALSARVPPLPLDSLPDLQDLMAAVRFGNSTGIDIWSHTPCSGSCPVGGML